MTTTSTIYAWEQMESDVGAQESPRRSLVIVCPRHATRTLLVPDALRHLAAIRAADNQFEAAVLACDSRCDWSATQSRALVSRALLSVLAPGGRFLLQAPDGFAQRPMLLALLEALTQLVPRADVSFGIQFEASVAGTSSQSVRRAGNDTGGAAKEAPRESEAEALRRHWN